MKIKHIHPAYESKEERLEQIRNVRRACIEQLEKYRKTKQDVGTA